MPQKTRLMGVLNVTPDSFYDGGSHFNPESAIARGVEMAAQGADIIDVGGESTRPPVVYKGSGEISEEEELTRVLPVIRGIRGKSDIAISIDTKKPGVALKAVQAGATLINDVSGFTSPEMREVAATLAVDVCCMHMQGNPATMQINPQYPKGVIHELMDWFDRQANLLSKAGVRHEKIILDPGIGFGKTVDHNVEILQNLRKLKTLGFPLLLGVSRKSFMGRILQRPPSDLLPTTLAVNALAIANDEVDYIRVHDVAEHRLVIDLLTEMSRLRDCRK